MFKIDFTKKELSHAINENQRNLNYNNTERHKLASNDLFIAKTLKIPQENKVIHKNLADIQKGQIELKKLDAANDLIKSRIQDEQNLLSVQQRFPYGKQNVDISEDVLQRYKGNYYEQSRILQKFRLQAQLMRKTSKARKNGNTKQIENWALREYPIKSKQTENELKKMRQTIQKQYDQQRQLRELDKKHMRNIADTLSSLSLQLHNNSYTLQKGIRQLQTRLKKVEKGRTQPIRPKHQYKDILDIESSSRKIPVIVYKDQPHDARLYFSDMFKNTQKISKQKISNVHKEEYKQITKILNQNNRRLAYLNRISSTQNLY